MPATKQKIQYTLVLKHDEEMNIKEKTKNFKTVRTVLMAQYKGVSKPANHQMVFQKTWKTDNAMSCLFSLFVFF